MFQDGKYAGTSFRYLLTYMKMVAEEKLNLSPLCLTINPRFRLPRNFYVQQKMFYDLLKKDQSFKDIRENSEEFTEK